MNFKKRARIIYWIHLGILFTTILVGGSIMPEMLMLENPILILVLPLLFAVFLSAVVEIILYQVFAPEVSRFIVADTFRVEGAAHIHTTHYLEVEDKAVNRYVRSYINSCQMASNTLAGLAVLSLIWFLGLIIV